MPPRDALLYESRILAAAHEELVSRNFEISEDSAGHLHELIVDGARRLSQGAPEPADLDAADRAIRLFVETMGEAAEIQVLADGTEGRFLTETTFAFARNSLCPIWPFCQ